MDVKALRTFLTLSKTLNYPRAAEMLNFAPSTLNRHIRLMEEELGVRLFEKNGRWLTMTPAGQSFVGYAQKMVETYEDALRNVGMQQENADRLSVGGCEIVLTQCMADVFSAFVSNMPRARLSPFTSANAGVPDLIKNGAADVGFYYTADPTTAEGLCDTLLFKENICIVAAPNHPFAQRKKLHYEDLSGAAFVHTHDDCCAATALFRELECRNVKLGSVVYLGVMQLVMDCAAKGEMLMLVPRASANHLARTWGMKTLDLEEAPLQLYAHMVCKEEKHLASTARALTTFCRGYARKITGAEAV